MTQNNLAIRIQLNNQQPQELPPLAKSDGTDPQWEILWGRIMVVGLLTLGGAGFGLWTWQNNKSIAHTPRAAAVPSHQTTGTLDAEPRLVAPVSKPTVPGEPKVPEPQTATHTISTTPATTTTSASPTELPNTEQAPNITARVSPVSGNLSSTKNAKLELFSSKIKNAALSQHINKRQPGAPLPSVISMEGNQLITVYFFANYENLKGTWIHHEWYLNDKRVARVKARPHKQLFNAYASKYIDQNMKGNWQVKVVTEDKTLLATAAFEVVP